jgi:hypothetical protein
LRGSNFGAPLFNEKENAMFSITKKYVDYNGVEKEETFWFNLNKRELTGLVYGPAEGLDGVMEKIIHDGASGQALDLFEEIVLKSYGKKMPDGRFAKVDDNGRRYADTFRETVVYDDIIMDLMLNTDSLIKFFNGVVPADLKAQTEEQTAALKKQLSLVE